VFRVERVVVAAIQSVERSRVIAELGLSDQEAAALLAPDPPASTSIQERDPEAEPRRLGAFIGTVLLYMSILIFGQFVLMGVLEEKSSRVVEVVLSRVTPRQVLTGKVMGIGVLGLSQLLLFGAAVWFTMSQVELDGVSLGGVSMTILVPVILWYLLGYAFFSVVYAALGATISRQEDMQGVVIIPVILLLPGYFISLIGSENPTSTLVEIASLVPPTSPMVMPMRQAVSDVPAWEVGVAAGLIIATAYGLILLGGRIYRGAILRIGAKVKLREAWRSAAR
jgi:ABC-2 type transport system permease protein